MPLSRLLFLAGALVVALSPARAADVVFKISDATGRPAADAVISLVSLDGTAPVAKPGATVEIVQQKEQFVPLVTAVTVGTSVAFANRESGRTEHQIYSLSESNKFEIGLHKPGNTAAVVFDQPGVVAVGCNVHTSMSAYVVVVATPWFAKSTAQGAAAVSQLPPGRYRAEVWHPRLNKPQPETRIITLPGTPADLAFALSLKPEPRVRRILDGGSGGYK